MPTINTKTMTRDEYLDALSQLGNAHMLIQLIEHIRPLKDKICFELGCLNAIRRCPICFDGDKKENHE